MIEAADSLVSKLIEEDGRGHSVQSVSQSHHRHMSQQVPLPNDSAVLPPPAPVIPQVPPPHQQAPVHTQHSGSPDIWFYRDPQGNVQGPFATTEMQLWLTQGYFSGGLLLRRECDRIFISLSEMGKLYGRNPFSAIQDTPTPPPLQVSPVSLPQPFFLSSNCIYEYVLMYFMCN